MFLAIPQILIFYQVSPSIVVSIIYLKGFEDTAKIITVECGMHTKALARYMIKNGYKGFEGLVDLPGTISGAVYGNAGCYDCLISDYLISVKVLTAYGEIVEYSKEELGFRNRSSLFKEGFINGIILTVSFEKVIGDKTKLENKAKIAHEHRLATQPKPTDNLGSIFKRDKPTRYGNWIGRIGRVTAKIFGIPEESHQILKLNFIVGYSRIQGYLFDMNRFIWKDANAHKMFGEYLKLRKKLYQYNDFEIEVFQ